MKERAKKRLFIAIDISAEACRAAASYIDSLKRAWPDYRISWTKPENLHLTLKFLGDTEEAKIDAVGNALINAVAAVSKFQIEIGETGVFPSPRKPKVLWLGISDISGNLKKATHGIEKNCAEIGFPEDERDFSPHLTIGRVRDPRSAREMARAHIRNEFEPVRFDVSRVVLYESKLGSGGSVYTPLIRAELME
jgi:RNA 2',3'-cyclic 3'-phosphodiesterase